ncbi:ankyrin repeat domain-containing protein [Myxococcaceae bacterium GXIMD 01537]
MAKKTKRVNVWELSREGTPEQLAAFLASRPESYQLDSLVQSLASDRRSDLMPLLLAHEPLPLFGLGAALSHACRDGFPDMLALLLATPLDREKVLKLNGDSGVETPLELAARAGSLGCVEALLAAGADPMRVSDAELRRDVAEEDRASPLLNAIRAESLEVVRRLLKAGVDPNRMTKADRRPLDVARALGHGTIAQALEEAGAVGVRPEDLNLEKALIRGYTERAAHLLKEAPVSPEELRRLAYEAGRFGQLATIEVLIAHGLDAEGKYRALYGAVLYEHFPLAEPLLAMGAPPDPSDGTPQQTPLLLAGFRDQWGLVLRLLAAGAKPNLARNMVNEGPLLTAARVGNIEVARALLAAGADWKTKTEYGDTALSEARKRSHTELVALLEKAGAKARTPEQIVKDLKKKLAPLARDCWKPKLSRPRKSRGHARGSRFGGLPFLGVSDAWPSCRKCTFPLSFALQVELSDLPEGHPAHGEGLVQLFFCTTCSHTNEVVRIVHGEAGEAAAPDVHRFTEREVSGWQKASDLPFREPGDATFDKLTTTLEPEEKEALFKLNLQGDKAGGWPNWVQDNSPPKCPECRRGMGTLMLQIDSERGLDWMWGDNGVAFIFQCAEHPTSLGFTWQCA